MIEQIINAGNPCKQVANRIYWLVGIIQKSSPILSSEMRCWIVSATTLKIMGKISAKLPGETVRVSMNLEVISLATCKASLYILSIGSPVSEIAISGNLLPEA